MITRIAAGLLATAIASAESATLAQSPPPPDSRPAPSNVAGAAYPRIHPDLRLTFRLKAPDAKKVQVAGGDGLGKGPFDMTRAADGTWEVTTPPAVPGFHYYWFVLDGAAVADPASEAFSGSGNPAGGVEPPEAGADSYDAKAAPRGEFRAPSYPPKGTAQPRRAMVYTPP